MVPFRPYYEHHFRCLGTADFENLYGKFRVEKQTASATAAAAEEIVPFARLPSVGTWLGWKGDDPIDRANMHPLSGGRVTSPVARLASPMSPMSPLSQDSYDVENLDAPQDCAFISKDVVDRVVFQGVNQLGSPGTPRAFHEASPASLATANELEASPASQYVSFLTSLHLQAEDDPLEASHASQATLGGADLGPAVTSPASAAALYVSFLTTLLQDVELASPRSVLPRPAEMVPFRPYYEHHFRCLGTADFENLYGKFQVEKQTASAAPPATAEEIVPSEIVPFARLPSVGTWLGWKVADPVDRWEAPLSDGSASPATRNAAELAQAALAQARLAAASPMSQDTCDVENLDDPQDCGFISTEVVDNVVFGGMGQFKPGTPQFHQADTSLVAVEQTAKEEANQKVVDRVLSNALRVLPGCDASEAMRSVGGQDDVSNASPVSGATVNDFEVTTDADVMVGLVIDTSVARSSKPRDGSEASEVVDAVVAGEAAVARSMQEVVSSMHSPENPNTSPNSPQWANSSVGVEDVAASVQGLDDAIADIHKEPTPGPRDSRDSLNITIFVAESPHLLSLE
ncbi:unnamed protein product [Cladocopium goreaui]|uniref:Uncharacterized protein n=1 Tax=Cladocopium goreaui TaxID=2562237 RepID=A0A9P1BU23_9DINO|nr:unnamed protein product [Cladocopium goreaui]